MACASSLCVCACLFVCSCCWRVHACVYKCVCVFPAFISIQKDAHSGWLWECSCLCQTDPELGFKKNNNKRRSTFSPPFGHKWKKNVKNETKKQPKKKHLLSHTKWNFYIGWVGRNQEDTQKDNIWTVPRAQIKWTQIGPCFPSSWDVTVKYTVNVTEKHYHAIS